MGDDGCAAGRGATPSEIVWVLAPVIAIICAMAFFGARRFGLIGGRPAAADRRPEAFAADLVVSHPLKVIALNVWLITALSVSAFVDVGCGELRESIDVLLDVDAYTKADNRASEWYSAFEAAKGDSGSPAALEKAKEAAKKERVLCKQREVSPCRRGVAVLFVFSR